MEKADVNNHLTDKNNKTRKIDKEEEKALSSVDVRIPSEFSRHSAVLADKALSILRWQLLLSGLMMLIGLLICIVKEDGVAIVIGSLVQGNTVVSNITINLGALMLIGGFLVACLSIKDMDIKIKIGSRHR